MLETDCPGNTEVPDCWELAENALLDDDKKARASCFKIKSYFTCKDNNAIKEAIMTHGPVLASIKWYDSYKPDKDGVLATKKVGDRGYHAIMIYGWDKVGFKCQNSWGKLWGNKGRFIIPYSIKIAEARGFIDEVNTNIIVPKRNAFFDLIYNILNFILNIFKK
jgi:C1A family cysteine protease